MTGRAFWTCAFVPVLAGTAVAEETPRNFSRAPRQAATPYRFSTPAEGAVVCRPHERQCQMGHYIVWCCRGDQACDHSHAGGCR
jgi:hypothetical protein